MRATLAADGLMKTEFLSDVKVLTRAQLAIACSKLRTEKLEH